MKRKKYRTEAQYNKPLPPMGLFEAISPFLLDNPKASEILNLKDHRDYVEENIKEKLKGYAHSAGLTQVDKTGFYHLGDTFYASFVDAEDRTVVKFDVKSPTLCIIDDVPRVWDVDCTEFLSNASLLSYTLKQQHGWLVAQSKEEQQTRIAFENWLRTPENVLAVIPNKITALAPWTFDKDMQERFPEECREEYLDTLEWTQPKELVSVKVRHPVRNDHDNQICVDMVEDTARQDPMTALGIIAHNLRTFAEPKNKKNFIPWY